MGKSSNSVGDVPASHANCASNGKIELRCNPLATKSPKRPKKDWRPQKIARFKYFIIHFWWRNWMAQYGLCYWPRLDIWISTSSLVVKLANHDSKTPQAIYTFTISVHRRKLFQWKIKTSSQPFLFTNGIYMTLVGHISATYPRQWSW